MELITQSSGRTTNVWYVAVSFQCWGRGKTIEKAKKELKRAGGNLKTYLVYRFDVPVGQDPPWVDEAGNTVCSRDVERVTVIAVKKGKPVDPATL